MHNSTVVFDANNTTKTKSYKIIIHTMLKKTFLSTIQPRIDM